MRKNATSHGGKSTKSETLSRGNKSMATLKTKAVRGVINKDTTNTKGAKSKVTKEKGGVKLSKEGWDDDPQATDIMDGVESGSISPKREDDDTKLSWECKEQNKIPLVAASASKRCIAVNMSHNVLKRLIAAQKDGSSMKIKVAKDIKDIEITLNGKDKFQFTKTPVEKFSKILLLTKNQMEVVGDIKYQVTSTKESNYKAKTYLATKKLSSAYKKEKIERERKKIQVIDPLPDPDVVKPKNPKANRPPRRKDPSMSYCVPASSSFISNDDTSGVPLRKRVIHLMAATELVHDLLSTDQIVTRVKDSKEKVQKVLEEVAELKKGTWKLTNSAWLTLEPYNWSSYRQKVISGIVQRMNEIADQMGLPQDSPQRPRQPKPPNHSANIDVGESSSRKRIKTGSGSFSEVQQSNDALHPGTIRVSKSTKAGKNTKGRGAKTLTSLQRHDDDDIEHDSKNARGAKSIRGRGNKTTTTTNASSITAEPTTSHANQQNARPKRGRPLGSKTSRANKTSTVKSTITSSNVEPSKPETNEVNGHTLVNGINNESKQNKYRVNTLTEFQDLIDEFNAKQNEYHELDSKLAGWHPLYTELSVSLRSARQSREKPIINRIMETFGSGSEVFNLVEQFNAVEEELCQISAEAWRAAKEGILDE
ncbi:RNA polymerase II transcription elongation factor SpELL [Gigaspora margarita]|uniref:RNA polymerase II transcription elongation factor SpELL n=1 Tax=Gigaspora margarita TaxID=4874 RepID=A0A8H4B2U7_GIGMA|nr:RNA polymerase II transcription elongation factor SpELL [Gigaspora margarita]